MFYFSEALIVSCLLCFFTPLLCHRADGDPCESLLNTPFEICKEAGYETMVPYPIDATEESKEEYALDMKKTIEIMKSKNCAASGLVEAIECSLFAPKCNSLGDPIFPCRRVCAEYLKQCKKELHSFDLHELIPHCLLLPNETSSCTQCFFPPNFTTSSDPEPGPLDQGCVQLIIPACKNLNLYSHTLTSLEVQKDEYEFFYEKNYTKNHAETGFPDLVQEMLDLHPKCAENIKKLFCGQHFPPCFPHEGLRLYSLCRPLCDAIARDCPEFFIDNLPGAEYCGTMAKGKSHHGFCPSTHLPEQFSWLPYAELTEGPRGSSEATKATKAEITTAAVKSPETKAWAITVTVLLAIVVVGIVVWVVLCWKMSRLPRRSAYLKPPYTRQTDVDNMHTLATRQDSLE